MAIINPVSFLQGRNDHSAQTDRLMSSALLVPDGAGNTWRQGVRGTNDLKVAPQDTPNMTVKVSAGQAYVTASTALNGAYHAVNDASANLTITAAHASLPRRDLIILRINDAAFSGSDNEGVLEVVTGSAASSPADPTVTGTHLKLARITVAAGASSINSGAVTDLRTHIAGLGGIFEVASNTERNALPTDLIGAVFNRSSGQYEGYFPGVGWAALLTAPITQTFTPDWGTAITLGTGPSAINQGRIVTLGSMVTISFDVQLGTGGTVNSTPLMQLPYTQDATSESNLQKSVGEATLFDTSAGVRRLANCTILINTGMRMFIEQSNVVQTVSSVVPWSWAVGDSISGTFTYFRVP